MTPAPVSTTQFLVACVIWAAAFWLALALCWHDASETDRRERTPRRKG